MTAINVIEMIESIEGSLPTTKEVKTDLLLKGFQSIMIGLLELSYQEDAQDTIKDLLVTALPKLKEIINDLPDDFLTSLDEKTQELGEIIKPEALASIARGVRYLERIQTLKDLESSNDLAKARALEH